MNNPFNDGRLPCSSLEIECKAYIQELEKQLADQRRNKMQEVNIIMSKNPAFNFVGVRFDSYKTYYYKTVEELAVGDKVVAAVGPNLRFKVGEIVEVDCMYKVDGSFKYKWIVQKIDFSTYEGLEQAIDEKGE